jgi:hypothetical protein
VFKKILTSLLSLLILLIGSSPLGVDAVGVIDIRAANTNLNTKTRISTMRQVISSVAIR